MNAGKAGTTPDTILFKEWCHLARLANEFGMKVPTVHRGAVHARGTEERYVSLDQSGLNWLLITYEHAYPGKTTRIKVRFHPETRTYVVDLGDIIGRGQEIIARLKKEMGLTAHEIVRGMDRSAGRAFVAGLCSAAVSPSARKPGPKRRSRAMAAE